ncbi:MAG: trigger factor [Chloroflexi bacterium]|nr:trigger factor [Chloroflexota bacterium]
MNVQTERLENHTVRLTVEVPKERFDQARASVIRKVSGRINIPGFRKGKVPPSMVVKYVGEAYILEEVMESLGQDVYKEALESAGIEPAAPGSMDDFAPEPEVKFTYTVPLAPEVTLGDYRSFRLEFNEPETTENDVDVELRMLQREFAETTESEGAVEAGDRITCDLHSFFVAEDAEAAEGEIDVHDREEEPYVHRHGAVIDLREGDDEPLAPGFTAQMVGAATGETRTFRITLPSGDPKINEDAAGRTVEFVVTVQKIEKVTLPELNDELAAQISERYGWDTVDESATATEAENAASDESEAVEEAEVADEAADAEVAAEESSDESEPEEDSESLPPATRPLNLAELRERIRDVIESRSKDEARQTYANSVLEHVIETSTVAYHEASVEQQIDDMIEDFKERLQQNRLSLDLYLKSTGRTMDDVRADYRPSAENQLRRSLAVREFAQAERLSVSQEDLNARLQTVFADIGAEAVGQLGLLNNPQFASNLINNLMSQKIEERAVAIGRGEAPELGQAEEAPEQEPSPEATESSTEQ